MKRTLVLIAALLPWATPAAGQTPPPDADWVTFRTAHFRVTYAPELEALARRAAAVAERGYDVLREDLADPPSGTIDLLITDHVDYTNGLANIFPSSRITVYARPPTSMPQLAWSGGWMELIVVHELVHIFHLGESGGFGHAVRAVFGRVPSIWPIFPVAASPTWNVEGLATYYESRLTGAGRVRGSFHRMIARTAALEDRIPDLDELSAPSPVWPSGQRSYGYGSRLMAHVAERFGPEAHREIVEATGESLLPTFLAFDHVAEDAVGEPFDALYEDWRNRAAREARAQADAVEAAGVTLTEPVAGRGPYAAAPRVSPDGRRLSFAADDFRSPATTRVLDLATGETRPLNRRNQFGTLLGPASWTPDGGAMVMAQLEFEGPHRVYSDLWSLDLDGRQTRLTEGERLAQPDVAPDGRRVAAVRARAGSIQLVVHELDSGETRLLLDAAPGDAFDGPRWSPDGRRIAVARDAGGRIDVVVVDAATGAISRLTDDGALDLAPAWSPDGEWVLWWSDRTGIPNLLAARPDADPIRVRQVTNVLTGAFDPEAAPDGRTLYLSVYHHDGWQIEAMPFEPDSWRDAPPSVTEPGPGLLGEVRQAQTAEPSPYSAWPTVRPYHWLPEWITVSSALGGPGPLVFLGLRTRGRDLVGRHDWSLSAGVDPGTGRVRGAARWSYHGLGWTDLDFTAGRHWRHNTTVELSGDPETIWERVDRAGVDALFWRARWRSLGWVRLGADMQRQSLHGHRLSDAELASTGVDLAAPRTLVGLSGGPGYTNADVYPFSISAEDGVSMSVGLGRWWDVSAGEHAYDEVAGRLTGYRSVALGGFADHVLAARVAGVARRGPVARALGIGGVPGGGSLPNIPSELGNVGLSGNAFLAVRGYHGGARSGTRAVTGSGEWRFPLHLRNAPTPRVLGFSLVSVWGATFVDGGYAWCPAAGGEALGDGCDPDGAGGLASAGAELGVDFGVFHNQRLILRAGVAQPLTGDGRRPVPYLSLGRAF